MTALELLPLVLLLLSLVALIPIFRHRRLPPSPIGIPIIGHFHLLGPLLHRSFRDLSRRWSSLFSVRLGSIPCVVVSSPDLAKEFLKTHELSFSDRKSSIAIARLTYDSSMAFSPYNTYWKFIRRLTMNELLGNRPLSGFTRLRSRELRRFLRVLADKSSRHEAINLSAELAKLSSTIIAQMVLGCSSDTSTTAAMDKGRAEVVTAVVRQVTKIFGEFNLSDYIWFLRRLDLQGLRKRIEEIFRKYDSLIETVLGEREELRRKRKDDEKEKDKEINESVVKYRDFLDILLDQTEDQKDENVQVTRLHVKALIVDIFTAGTDTTATSIEWTLSELINNPTILEKAREEIERVVGKTRLVSEADIPNLPYIQAVVKEALRLHPALPLLMRKCARECRVGEHVIPVGTMLIVNIWAIGRDPRYWESPLEFRPERFLQSHGSDGSRSSVLDIRGQHFELLPFGTGRRMCPGMNLALQMLPLVVAALIQCFDLKVVGSLDDGKDGHRPLLSMEEAPGLAVPRLHELICVPSARLSSITDILAPEI